MHRNKLILLIVFSLLSVILWRWALPAETCVNLYRHCIYWILLMVTGLMVVQLWRIHGSALKGKVKTGRFWISSGALLLAAFLQQVHENYEYKVVADDISLVGISQNFHLDREASVPYRAYEILGVYDIMDSEVDKRPAFYSFLVSLVHDLTGYRAGNAFVTNFLLGWLILALGYLLGQQVSGLRGGWMAVLLLATLPQLARSITGAGMEPANLACILGIWLALLAYLKNRDEAHQGLLCLIALLLFNARYESPVFALTIGLVVLVVWINLKKVQISWTLIFSPLLLLPVLWHRRIVEVNALWWEVFDKSAAGAEPFSLSYAGSNLAHAWNFFGDLGINQPNNFFILFFGLPAILLFLVHALRTGWSKLTHWERLYLIFLPNFLILFLVLILYRWGQLDDVIAQRLALPFYLPLIYGIIWVIYRRFEAKKLHYPSLVIYTLLVILTILPTKARHVYDDKYMPAAQLKWCEQFIEENRDRDYVMVSDWPFFWIAHGIEAITIDQLNQNKGKLKFQLQYHPEKEFLACTRTLHLREQDTKVSLHDLVPLDKSFRLEMEQEKFFSIFISMQISRIGDIEGIEAEAYQPGVNGPDANEYFRHYISNLP